VNICPAISLGDILNLTVLIYNVPLILWFRAIDQYSLLLLGVPVFSWE
jgi:hypothetical protein